MMPNGQRFPNVEVDPSLGAASALPYVPMTLGRGERRVLVGWRDIPCAKSPGMVESPMPRSRRDSFNALRS